MASTSSSEVVALDFLREGTGADEGVGGVGVERERVWAREALGGADTGDGARRVGEDGGDPRSRMAVGGAGLVVSAFRRCGMSTTSSSSSSEGGAELMLDSASEAEEGEEEPL